MTYTPHQKQAIETVGRRVCVDAGAGSGKTRVLVDRIVHILDKRLAELDQIVAITFTDAAAAEMKVRLRQEFHNRAPVDDPIEMTRWRDLERYVEMARVSTIHSFCAGLLRENALRVGLDPDFAVLAEAETQLLRNEVVTQTIHRLLDGGGQAAGDRAAGDEVAGDEAAVRCATEYGTKVLIENMESLLKSQRMIEAMCKAHPLEDPAALTEHWKRLTAESSAGRLRALAASRELREFRAGLAAFDGLCFEPADARESARRRMVSLLDDIASETSEEVILDRVKQIASMVFGRASKKKWNPEADLDRLKDLQEHVRDWATEALPAIVDDAVERRAAELTVDVYRTYRKVSDAFRNAKNDRTSLDFDDLIAMTADMLRDSEEIRTRTAHGIRFLLIDEFQDTDASQLEIARLLVECPGGPQLFLVGDAKQSIYDFRGAEVQLFQDERTRAEERIVLAENFRTVPEILGFANDFFESTQLLAAVEPRYECLASSRNPAGECRIEFLVPYEVDGTLVDDYRVEEATLIANRLASMCRGPEPAVVFDKQSHELRQATFGDIAMLFRSSTKIYLYERALRECGIPYNVVAGPGFYERQEVTDLRNLLAVLADPWDEPALLGFLRSPIGALSDEALVCLCAGRGLVPGFCGDTVPDGFPQPDRLDAARTLVRDLRLQCQRPLAEFLRYLMDRTGYEAIVLSQFLGLQKALNVRKVIDLAEDFTRTRPADLAAFVRYLDMMTKQETREGDATLDTEASGSVTLMTIHKAKGLEFPIVVVPDISQRSQEQNHDPILAHRRLGFATRFVGERGQMVSPAMYESIKREKGDKRTAEHARILYVAMTRARDWLLLSGTPKAPASSWMSSFDKHLNLMLREDGEVIQEGRWSARIRRRVGSSTWQGTEERPETAPPELCLIERRAEPLSLAMTHRRSFSVSEILHEMFPGNEQPHEKTGAEDPAEGLLRGTLAHRMFEQWDFVSAPPIDQVLDDECVESCARQRLSAYLHDVAERFRASDLIEHFRSARTLQREAPFVLRIGDALVNGVIDALLDENVIIDYKTGRQTPERSERYEFQICLYAAATVRLTGRPVNTSLLYYADLGEVCPVDTSPVSVEQAVTRAQRAIESLRSKVIPYSECHRYPGTAEV